MFQLKTTFFEKTDNFSIIKSYQDLLSAIFAVSFFFYGIDLIIYNIISYGYVIIMIILSLNYMAYRKWKKIRVKNEK